jgi:hypothetical protein
MKQGSSKKATPHRPEDSDEIFEESQEEELSSHSNGDAEMSNIDDALAGRKQSKNTAQTSKPEVSDLDRVAMSSAAELLKGEITTENINATLSLVCKKRGFNFVVQVNGPREDGLRRQLGLSISEKEGKIEVRRLPAPIEYKPVMDALSNWWRDCDKNPANGKSEMSSEKLLKTFWVDYMQKEDYIQVASECAKMLVGPEVPAMKTN